MLAGGMLYTPENQDISDALSQLPIPLKIGNLSV